MTQPYYKLHQLWDTFQSLCIVSFLYHDTGEYSIQIGWRGVDYFSIKCTAMAWS